jgi:hypothetical protein
MKSLSKRKEMRDAIRDHLAEDCESRSYCAECLVENKEECWGYMADDIMNTRTATHRLSVTHIRLAKK